MGKRRPEGDGLVPCFSERSRPAADQPGGRLLRDLCASATHDQTHLEGGDARHGTSEPPGPAQPANTCTAGVAARLGQPQQQRLIADPLLHVQPRALPRRSSSSYAWQVEVATGKLVTAASKPMCKEHGAGARCRLRKAAANQITALRYIGKPKNTQENKNTTAAGQAQGLRVPSRTLPCPASPS